MVHNVNKKPKIYLEIDAFDSSLKALNEIKSNQIFQANSAVGWFKYVRTT